MLDLGLNKFTNYPSGTASVSSGQSSWSQIQRSWFYSQLHHIFLEVVDLERGPLSLVSITGDPFH
jgi:hypothetical protein